MQRDSHDGQADTHNTTNASRRVTASSGLRSVRTSTAALVSLFALAGLTTVSCDDKDTTAVDGRGGSGGRAGAAGAAGRGGSAGAAGRGGSAGAAGAAGAAGRGGTGGSNGGSSGSTGDPDASVPDAAVPDGGDAGPVVLDRAGMAAAVCATMDQLVDCDPEPTCAADLQSDWADLLANDPGCSDELDAFFRCMAGESVDAYYCDGANPSIEFAGHGCVTEEEAFYFGLGTNCGDPI